MTEGTSLVSLPIDSLQPHPKNKALGFEDYTGSKWDEFVDNVRANGIIQPVIVTPAGESEQGAPLYRIISGHQRVNAARALGHESVLGKVNIYESEAEEEAHLISANAEQREYSYAQRLRMAARLLDLMEPQKNKGGRGHTNSVNSSQSYFRDRVADATGLTEHDISAINNIKKRPPAEQVQLWAAIEELNPNKAKLRRMLVETSKAKKAVGRKNKELSAELAAAKRQLKSAKAYGLAVYAPEHEYINIVDDVFARGRTFFAEELGRLRLNKAAQDGVHALMRHGTMRLRAREFLAQVTEYYFALEELLYNDMPAGVPAHEVAQAVQEKRAEVRERMAAAHHAEPVDAPARAGLLDDEAVKAAEATEGEGV